MPNDLKRLLVFGAYSGIARAVLRLHAQGHPDMMLIGRDARRLEDASKDLLLRGARSARILSWDFSNVASHPRLFETLRELFPDPDSAFLCYGSLPDHREAQEHPEKAVSSIELNYLSSVSLILHTANAFASPAKNAPGSLKCIAAVTSVAGDLGRKSNYIYGSSKGGLSVFLEGLRWKFHGTGVSVVDVRPGFVDTPMTQHLRKGFLVASPQAIAPRILRAMRSGLPVVYVPFYWRYIMGALKLLPRTWLYRLPL